MKDLQSQKDTMTATINVALGQLLTQDEITSATELAEMDRRSLSEELVVLIREGISARKARLISHIDAERVSA